MKADVGISKPKSTSMYIPSLCHIYNYIHVMLLVYISSLCHVWSQMTLLFAIIFGCHSSVAKGLVAVVKVLGLIHTTFFHFFKALIIRI